MGGQTRSSNLAGTVRTVVRAASLVPLLLFAAVSCSDSPAAPGRNAPPVVRVTFEGSSTCSPRPSAPCTLTAVAQASDPDRDSIRYAWSGCAAGAAARAICTVERPGDVVASVEVRDEHGAAATAAATGSGANEAPTVRIGYVWVFAGSFDILGNIVDPEEGLLCGRQYCTSAVAAGACSVARFECTCLAGLEASLVRSAPTGTCTLTFTVTDGWGQRGSPSFTFDVANPRLPAAGLTPAPGPHPDRR